MTQNGLSHAVVPLRKYSLSVIIFCGKAQRFVRMLTLGILYWLSSGLKPLASVHADWLLGSWVQI